MYSVNTVLIITSITRVCIVHLNMDSLIWEKGLDKQMSACVKFIMLKKVFNSEQVKLNLKHNLFFPFSIMTSYAGVPLIALMPRNTNRPSAKRSKTCSIFTYKSQSDRLPPPVGVHLTQCESLRNQDTSRDAAVLPPPERAARPADCSGPRWPFGRQERASPAAPGSVHVLRHHPAACVHAETARGSVALLIRTGTLKRASTYFGSRVEANNWSHAPGNV